MNTRIEKAIERHKELSGKQFRKISEESINQSARRGQLREEIVLEAEKNIKDNLHIQRLQGRLVTTERIINDLKKRNL